MRSFERISLELFAGRHIELSMDDRVLDESPVLDATILDDGTVLDELVGCRSPGWRSPLV